MNGTTWRALITNDDGIDSPGLVALAKAALRAGFDVVVAAPHEEASGTSAGLTVLSDDDTPMVREVELPGLPGVPAFAVAAHPAFITLAALDAAFGGKPDLVLSGVNRGINVGRAVPHSGTVGAALTAGVNGLRALAVSVALPDSGELWWDTAEEAAVEALGLLVDSPEGTVLNVNVPAVPPSALGVLVPADLSTAGAVQTTTEDSEGNTTEVVTTVVYGDAEPGTDAYVLEQEGKPTITALRPVSADPDFKWPETR